MLLTVLLPTTPRLRQLHEDERDDYSLYRPDMQTAVMLLFISEGTNGD